MRSSSRLAVLWVLGLSVSFCFRSGAARAQEPEPETERATQVVDEIVVTAEKRAEAVSRLPTAISAFSGETLKDRGVEEIDSLPRLVPNLTLQSSNGSFTNISLRGITAPESSPSAEPPIAISQDGVPYGNALLSGLSFFDIERVEVLRGPQGTIAGRNATAGAINVISKRPTKESEGGVRFTLGNYYRLATEGYLSGPILDGRLLGRIAVATDRADGWVDNKYLGEDVGTTDRLQARAGFLVPVDDRFEALLLVEALRDASSTLVVDDGRVRPDMPSLPEFLGAPAFDRNARTVFQDISPSTRVEKYQTTLNLAWNLGPSARVTAVTGYVDLWFDATSDVDGTLEAVIQGPPQTEPLIFDLEHVSQEITLTADLTDRLDMILGTLYLREEWRNTSAPGLPLLGIPPGAIDLDSRNVLSSWAAYTQWRYRPIDAVRLTGGVRYTRDRKERVDRNVIFGEPAFADVEASWDSWTPRVTVEYLPGENTLFYTSASRGFASGGFSGSPLERFDPAHVWNYEAGMKARWLDQRVITGVTAFYMDYSNLQANVSNPEDPRIFRVVNAQSASIKGVEVEVDARLTEHVRVTVAGSWLDATYDELRSSDPLFPELGEPGPQDVNVRDLSGNRLVRAPEWSFNVSGEYRTPIESAKGLEAVLRIAYAWQDKIYFDLFNHEGLVQDSYGLVDMLSSIETSDGSWRFSAFISNLTDRYYRTFESQATFAPGAPGSNVLPGRPRTYGVSIERRF